MYKIKPGTPIKKINTILKNENEIKFLKGEYNITNTLILHSNTEVECEKGVVFKRAFNGRMIETYATPGTVYYKGAHNIEWFGGKFIADTNKEYANVISIFHAKNVTFQDVTITGCRGYHSIEINASKNVKILNCNISNQSSVPEQEFREAIQIDFANYDGLKWNGASEHSACYDGTHCTEIVIRNCTINNVPVGVGTHTICNKPKYHTNIKIANLKCNNVDTGIRIMGMKNVEIINSSPTCIVMKNIAHKVFGGKVKLNRPRISTNIEVIGGDCSII